METADSDFERGDGAPGTSARRESSLMRRANISMRDRSESLVASDSIPFFCECKNPTCYGGIWMSVAVFDARVAAETGWLLLDGHHASGLWYRSTAIPTRETVRARQVRPLAELAAPQPVEPSPVLVFHRRHTRTEAVGGDAA